MMMTRKKISTINKRTPTEKRTIGLEEHREISRDLKMIEKLAKKLILQFGTASRRTMGPYSHLVKIARLADQARRRAASVLGRDHRAAAAEDIYGLWK